MLRNNANYCYVKTAVRTILWAVAVDPTLETTLTNIGRSLIRGLFTHKGRAFLVAGHILFSAIFVGWRSPAQQHDCAEFLAHLIAKIGPGVCDGKWEARRQQVDSEGRHALQKVPNLLFLSFSRYGGRPGMEQKNSCSNSLGTNYLHACLLRGR